MIEITFVVYRLYVVAEVAKTATILFDLSINNQSIGSQGRNCVSDAQRYLRKMSKIARTNREE